MKTLLSIVFGVSICCLLPSKVMAADEAKPALFTIISAQYGAGDKWSDVTDKVKAAVQNDALIIDPANGIFGDPIGGTKKSLKVVVKHDGKEFAFQTGIDGIAGNYVAFRNQTASEFAIFPRCTTPSRIAINGIQIVANPPGERVISINFTALNDASAVLGSADVAGVIPRANWNNIQYNGNTYGFNPKDDTGKTIESTYVNCRLNSAYPGNHSYTSTVGNDRLMRYFCGNDETFPSTTGPLIRVSGLPASFLETGYSIYVYSDFNNNSDPHKIDLGTSLLDTNNQSADISIISTATIVDSGNWPGSGGGTFTEGATLTINKAVLDAKVKEKAAGEDPAKQILQLTGGARTKIVWFREVPGNYSIMILDTNEGRERVVTQAQGGWVFITPTGNRVIFGENSKLYVVDTSGQNKRELCPAHAAMGVAEDPPGTEWAYYADNKFDANPRGRLWRVQIDNPNVKELMWDKTSICWQWAFTRDGKVAAGALPWPGCHIANLPNGSYQHIHDSGCQVALAPSGKRMLHCTALQFGGEHRGISVHSAPWPGSDVEINLGDAPGVNNQTLLWPMWAMYDDRFFVIAGPNAPPRPRNILFAQFNAAFNGIANWVQVTQCPEGFNDCNPSCWIQSEPGVKDSAKMDPIETKPAEDNAAAGGWPADRKDLIFLWENRKGAFLAYDREGEAIPSL
ncbi:MAG TPA: hypothetical protein VM487_02980, partial [Phycisphaerae bacterium]|nr:hypothetical protein [Phycisphaerae bacterium]